MEVENGPVACLGLGETQVLVVLEVIDMGYNVIIPGEWHYKLISKVISIKLQLNDFPHFYQLSGTGKCITKSSGPQSGPKMHRMIFL